jgi:hypothetical protein
MNPSSRWVAAGVVLVTILVCYFGVRAELAQARQTESRQTSHLALPATADLACGTDAAARC